MNSRYFIEISFLGYDVSHLNPILLYHIPNMAFPEIKMSFCDAKG